VGAILGCIVLFACGVALSTFLVVTHWLAPAHAHFQQELFFDYTKSEATASTQFCPTLNGKVWGLWHLSSHHLQLCPDTLPPVLVLGTVLLMPTCLHVSLREWRMSEHFCSSLFLSNDITLLWKLPCWIHSASDHGTTRGQNVSHDMQGALRILSPGQRANIWLELRMPEVNGDVFQVSSLH